MELISIPGYTIEDKVPIAKMHLVPKQLKMHGLMEDSLQITDEGLKFLSKSWFSALFLQEISLLEVGRGMEQFLLRLAGL